MLKLRLQRHGKKGKPFFHIVAADARSKRDGRIVERIGSYNPNTNPATIDINFDRALYWVQNGAQPSDTCRAILSYKGVLMRDHLNRGVLKGALTQDQADAKFEKWLDEKNAKVQGKVDTLSSAESKKRSDALKAEAEVNEKRKADQEAKLAEANASEEVAEVEDSVAEAEENTPEENTEA
jgi:small subunit ribosomal protein S16